jgi:ATP-binding cassette subfamily G (WHITE) protein 2 (SNQ2)
LFYSTFSEYAEGHDEKNTPTTPEAQAKAYLESPMFREMQAEAQTYKQEMERDNSRQEEFRNAVSESKRKFVGKKSPYTVSFFTQVQALVQRQLILNVQDKLSLYSGFFTA